MAMRWNTTTRVLTNPARSTRTGKRSRSARAPLTAPRRNARQTPAWSRRAACERRPMRRVACGTRRV